MQNNKRTDLFHQIYLIGFLFILGIIPILTIPPWFFPPDWGKAILFRSIVAIFGFMLACQVLLRKTNISDKLAFLKKNKIAWGLLGVFIVFLLASIFSVDPHNSFFGSPIRAGGFIMFACYLFFSVLIFLLLDKKDWSKAWLVTIISGLFIAIIELMQFYGIFSSVLVSADSRPSSTLGNPIFLGIYLLMLFFPTLSFAVQERNKKLKVFYIAALAIFSYAILITGSRAAYFGLLVGAIYFLLFYSRKHLGSKISIIILLLAAVLSVYFINTHPQFAKIIQKNRTIDSVASRLSIKSVIQEDRFPAWGIALKAVKDKPILGYGPENLSVGFDKYYDPNIVSDPWWDRAHNILIDTASTAGVLGLAAYLLLFGAVLWKLYKVKQKSNLDNDYFPTHGVFASLLGYFVANIFSFDSFATYLIFFFFIGYALHISYIADWQALPIKTTTPDTFLFRYKKIWLSILLIVLVIFLWQYNIAPFQVNAQINIADRYADSGNCDTSLSMMKDIASQSSFIDSYAIAEYVSDLQKCAELNPRKLSIYAAIGEPLLKEAVKIQPLYTRYWLYLGSYVTAIANQETDQNAKSTMIKEAIYDFDRAQALSPKHYEILVQRSKIDIVMADYAKMKEDAQQCIDIKTNYYECYWIKALSELYVGDNANAQKDTATAVKLGFNENDLPALYQKIGVYSTTNQYDKLAQTYEALIAIDNKTAEYHSSLAFTYYKLGQYGKARQQALIFLQLMPEAKDEVNAFLKLLPY